MKRSLFALSCWFLAPAAFAILDTNNNGVSDLWEREFNAGELFLQNFDPQADHDSDGWTNAQEAAAGTNPFDPNPPDGLILPITNHIPAVIEEENGVPVVEIPEAITVTWPTLAGKQYTMYFSPDLTQGSWLPVGSPYIAQGGVSEYGFQELSVADKRFWRVAVEDVDEDNDGLTNHEEFLSGTNPMIADTDGDTLSDHAEIIAGTDPNHADADYDGMEDRWETSHGLDPTDWYDAYDDPDRDGIQNQFEYVLGFHPTVANPAELTADRDNDGMPDYWEAQTGSFQWSYATQQYEFQRMLDWENPADAAQDPDSDDLTNLAEYQNTTNPFDWDTDYDYLPDGWEIQHCLIAAYRIQVSGSWVYGSSGTNGRTGDPDSDGIQNQYEYVLGFHPTTADPAEPTADRDNDGMPDLWEAQTGSFKWSSQNQRYEFQRNFDWENSADASLDPDSDGLPNLAEYQNATNPFDYDTDGDNLSDGWEIQYSFNPKSTASPNGATDDPDADGIENQYEQALGFHPTTANPAELTADRDNDGMPDAWEAATAAGRHTSHETGTGITRLIRALDWEIDDSAGDYDSDGLANLLEYQAGLGVADPDSDDDLLPDGWEILYGFDPFVSSPDALTADPDGDGYSNFLEAMMGTNPYDPASHPPTPPGNNIPGTPYPGSVTYPPTPPTPPSPNTGTAQWSFEAVTSSKTLPKYGYAEFSPTVPPKRYLKLLESVSFGLHGECDPPESRIDGTRLTTVNPLDNTRQVDDRQHPGNNNMGGTTTAQSPVVAVGISQVTSYDDDPNSESDCDATKTYTLHLSQENTTAQLIANTRAQLPAYQSTYSTWQTPHAYRNLDDDELGLAYQKCRYRIKWQSGTAEEDRHRLTWLVVFQPETPQGQTEAPAPEILRSHQWDGTSETSPEYEIDPETEKPGIDGSYFILALEVIIPKLDGDGNQIDGEFVGASELKVAKWENAFEGTSNNGSVKDDFIGWDKDRFYIRISGGGNLEIEAVQVAAEQCPDEFYNDDPTSIDLAPNGSGVISDSMILVSDDLDDDYAGCGAGIDDQEGDRTHKAQLGGKFVIKSIIIQGAEHGVNLKIPVPVRKVLSVDFIRMNVPGVHSLAEIEQAVKVTNERYAQVGLRVDATVKEFPWPDLPGRDPGFLDLFDEYPGQSVGPLTAEYKRFIDETNSAGTNLFFLLASTGSRGVALTPRQLQYEEGELDGKYLDKAFIHKVYATVLGYTPAHELLHLLAYRPEKPSDHLEPFWNLLNVENINQTPSVLWSKRVDQVQQDLIDMHPSVSDPQ